MISRHAAGPQEDGDDDSDGESDLTDLESDSDATPAPPLTQPGPRLSRTSAGRKTTALCPERPILRAARARWEQPPPPNPTPPPVPSTSTRSSPQAPATSEDARKMKKERLAARAGCKIKRELLREVPGKPRAPKAVALVWRCQSSPVPVDFSFVAHPGVASTSWMGLRNPEADFEPEAREYSFEEAREIPGMRVLEWQGKPGPLVDADRYVFGLFGGQPRDPHWKRDVADPAAALIEEAAAGIYDRVFQGVYYGTRKEEKKQRKSKPTPRCGPHRAKSVGNSMGGGQEAPTGFVHNVIHTIVLTGLLAQKPFQRLAGFTNGLFRCYAPDLHAYYSETMEKLHCWNTMLRRNFLPTFSVFSAATFNFGLRTVTYPHLDFATLAWGWCAITALGDFDPDKGGHIILWDLKLIIRFPPGCTIFIPSALIRHSNTSIQPHEKRDVSVNESGLTAAEQQERIEARRTRWVEGLKMYPRWEFTYE
ncbi:hypothetical protein B0H14DRAFT_3646397 [Mycena olivaceomarginata]|nr:hypothetical protein B0H14DRAFT_3646397 [Mycena olivaceomarginata]